MADNPKGKSKELKVQAQDNHTSKSLNDTQHASSTRMDVLLMILPECTSTYLLYWSA